MAQGVTRFPNFTIAMYVDLCNMRVRTGERIMDALPAFGPKYPKLEGLEKFRRAARYAPMNRDEMRRYGEAVERAIRKLQYNELMSSLTPTPSLAAPGIPAPPSIERLKKYSKPNPFRMIGDPLKRTERTLYEQQLRK